ncbi:hypothetical protein TIFTF001_015656 [Ficus carica]|uniref:Uncharacterized protein n=1 Tax=Ficus carica TaxID=3494 RepID=A0AA88D958_FICCA|nr:hypothetical protein TIFTF001_015656 [Ficus carica]
MRSLRGMEIEQALPIDARLQPDRAGGGGRFETMIGVGVSADQSAATAAAATGSDSLRLGFELAHSHGHYFSDEPPRRTTTTRPPGGHQLTKPAFNPETFYEHKYRKETTFDIADGHGVSHGRRRSSEERNKQTEERESGIFRERNKQTNKGVRKRERERENVGLLIRILVVGGLIPVWIKCCATAPFLMSPLSTKPSLRRTPELARFPSSVRLQV